jgi:epoxyqueuosine reductase
MPLTAESIRQLAEARGFVAVRFAAVGPTPRGESYAAWIAKGSHGEMSYLARGQDKRLDPRHAMPEARTAIALAVPYPSTRPPDPGGLTGLVARYAWGRDYHNLVGKALKKLTRDLRSEGLRAWGGVDTAPILERAWASAAGLGVTGKSCVQFLPGRTSWMFLAVIFVDAVLPPDPPILADHCGSCARCLVACPTAAYRGPYDLDARRCIAYWTIEASGLAPRELRAGFGRWLFGCDVCQEVCPHNHHPPDDTHPDLAARHAVIDLDALLASSDEALLERYTGTPLRRPGAAGLKRNALVVLGNIGDPEGLRAVERSRLHASPVVRAAAAWAEARLGHRPDWAGRDASPEVQAELHAYDRGEVPTSLR